MYVLSFSTSTIVFSIFSVGTETIFHVNSFISFTGFALPGGTILCLVTFPFLKYIFFVVPAKLVPVGYGIKKLQIMLTIVDDLVSVDNLIEERLMSEPINEYVQSCDIVAFNKICEYLCTHLWAFRFLQIIYTKSLKMDLHIVFSLVTEYVIPGKDCWRGFQDRSRVFIIAQK